MDDEAHGGWPAGAAPASPDPVELLLSKEDFKFNAAHFVVHEVRGARPTTSTRGAVLRPPHARAH